MMLHLSVRSSANSYDDTAACGDPRWQVGVGPLTWRQIRDNTEGQSLCPNCLAIATEEYLTDAAARMNPLNEDFSDTWGEIINDIEQSLASLRNLAERHRRHED